ncbi:MAG: hypothetical protein AAFV71_27880 [Cyanobacteria bacterium J06633_8]
MKQQQMSFADKVIITAERFKECQTLGLSDEQTSELMNINLDAVSYQQKISELKEVHSNVAA